MDDPAEYDLESLAWTVDGDFEADFPFYRDFLTSSPGLALDAGCGTGRLLLEYLRLGFQVEGCDNSPEMLSLCRQRAKAAGLDPVLHHLAIQQLPFAGRYSAIYVACGTFMCIEDESEVDRCLRCLYSSLASGGRVALSIMLPSYSTSRMVHSRPAGRSITEYVYPITRGEIIVDSACPQNRLRRPVNFRREPVSPDRERLHHSGGVPSRPSPLVYRRATD